MRIYFFIYNMLKEITVTGTYKETQEKESHAETIATKIQTEKTSSSCICQTCSRCFPRIFLCTQPTPWAILHTDNWLLSEDVTFFSSSFSSGLLYSSSLPPPISLHMISFDLIPGIPITPLQEEMIGQCGQALIHPKNWSSQKWRQWGIKQEEKVSLSSLIHFLNHFTCHLGEEAIPARQGESRFGWTKRKGGSGWPTPVRNALTCIAVRHLHLSQAPEGAFFSRGEK